MQAHTNVSIDGRERHILLVEDDAGLATMVVDSLGEHGYDVRHVQSGRDAERAIDETRPDLIVLDLVRPDRNGLTLCRKLKDSARSPLIICSATRRKDDAVLAFQLGADDFLRKPFAVDELLARVDLALRRGYDLDGGTSQHATPAHGTATVRIDAARCEATADGHSLKLTPTEFRLLSSVASRAPDVVPRQELAECIWGCVDPGFIRSLDVHMRRLRAKLAAAAPSARLVARRGFGYQLLDGADRRFAS
jgi:DNA-binding response OmpR family regulator